MQILEPSKPTNDMNPVDRGALTVVVADDSDLLRGALVHVLEDMADVQVLGEAVTTAGAIDLVTQQEPDVLILDLRMPGGGGVPVLETVKTLPKPPIVVIFSAYDHESYRRACKEAGADYFFMKTRDNDHLLETLATLRSEHQRQRQTQASVANPCGHE